MTPISSMRNQSKTKVTLPLYLSMTQAPYTYRVTKSFIYLYRNRFQYYFLLCKISAYCFEIESDSGCVLFLWDTDDEGSTNKRICRCYLCLSCFIFICFSSCFCAFCVNLFRQFVQSLQVGRILVQTLDSHWCHIGLSSSNKDFPDEM